MIGAAAGCTGFLAAGGTASEGDGFVDVTRWNPGCACGLGTVNSLACWNGTFF